MTTLEQFSLFQRMAGSIKIDVEEGKTQKALGKIELLEGELGIMRQQYEPQEESEPAPAVSDDLSFMNEPNDIIDTTPVETEIVE